jgi:GNAT superfamily N-acetyltransferase
MAIEDVTIRPVGPALMQPTIRFLREWVTDSEASAVEHLEDHADGSGSSFVALLGEKGEQGEQVVGIATIRWQSNYSGFRDRGIPLLHQISVAEPQQHQGIATRLMDAAEQAARARGIRELGITVGLFDAYGPAQRMYAKRGYVPDGRGACLGPEPVREGTVVTVGHNLILWLTKTL